MIAGNASSTVGSTRTCSESHCERVARYGFRPLSDRRAEVECDVEQSPQPRLPQLCIAPANTLDKLKRHFGTGLDIIIVRDEKIATLYIFLDSLPS